MIRVRSYIPLIHADENINYIMFKRCHKVSLHLLDVVFGIAFEHPSYNRKMLIRHIDHFFNVPARSDDKAY